MCSHQYLALEIAQQRLEKDNTLSDHMFLTVCDIMSLLSLCLIISHLVVLFTSRSMAQQWRFVTGTLKKHTRRIQEQESTSTTSIVLPYISGLSDAIKRIISSANVKVYFKPHSTLRQLLVRVKDPTPIM